MPYWAKVGAISANYDNRDFIYAAFNMLAFDMEIEKPHGKVNTKNTSKTIHFHYCDIVNCHVTQSFRVRSAALGGSGGSH